MPFKTSLNIAAIKGTNQYRLTKNLIYIDKVYGEIKVPIRFKTDFASVPRFLHGVIDDNASYIREAAVVHDYLYSTGQLDRVSCDLVLERAMKELKASWFKRKLVYFTVRLFGSSHFKQKRGLK